MTDAVQLGLFGRTSSEPSPATADEISALFSTRWQGSGRWTSSGEYWTRNSSESPNADDASLSSLASILEPQVKSRYYLSARACAGILRRAAKRGRALPPALEKALTAVSALTSPEPLGGGSGERGWAQDVERMTFIPASQPTRETASCLRASSMNVDDHTAQDGHLVPMTDAEETEREREMTLDLPEIVGTLAPGAHPGGVNGQDAYSGQIIPWRQQ